MSSYPKLTSLISIQDLPSQFSFFEDGLNQVLDQLYFRNLQVVSDEKGTSVTYFLEVLSTKELAFGIPGTGFELAFNSAGSGSIASFPISLTFHLGINRYIQGFSLQNFSFSPDAFFNMAFDVTNYSDEALLKLTTTEFINDPDPLNTFAQDANSNYSLGISTPVSSDPDQAVEDILQAIDNHSGVTLQDIVFDDYILDSSSTDQTFQNLTTLLFYQIGEQPLEYIKKLFVPRISANLLLKAGIKIPRKVLKPMKKVNGEWVVENDTTIKSTLLFDPGEFTFDTETAIGFSQDFNVSLESPYERAQIGNTGMVLSFSTAKLDLSRKTNIPEADEDGRPKDFIGAYIKDASISLPDFLQEDQGYGQSQASIVANNLIIGTGGISGTIGLDNSGNNLGLRLGSQDGFAVELDTFSIEFQQNAIIGSSIAGTLTLPSGFKNQTTINIEAFFAEDGSFNLTAGDIAGMASLNFADVFEFDVTSVKFEWPKVAHNATYYLYKMNEKGNWVKIKNRSTNNDPVSVDLDETDWGSSVLSKEDNNGNTLYHRFKVEVENASGLLNIEDKEITI